MEYGVEVKLTSDFLVIKETLERIGICNRESRVITPTAYILHRRGRYYIMHFKCLLAMDGFKKGFDDKDIARQDAIATLLENWGMVDIVDRDIYQETLKEKIFVLSYRDKDAYTINHKYRMGNKRK